MPRASLLLPTEDRRVLPVALASVQLRSDDGDQALRFTGYATKFNSRTLIGSLPWGFYEEFAPGVYTKTLNEGDQRKLIQHDPYYVVARTSAGTLRLAQDKTGLAVDADLDMDLSYVADLAANIRNGNITGMSVGFRVIKDDWSEIDVGEANDGRKIRAELRVVQEAELLEVSSVTFPAYGDTDTGLRAVDPVRAVGLALSRRDEDLLESRAAHCPGLLAYRSGISSHSTATSDSSWDGPANKARLNNDAGSATFRKAFAWVDPDGDVDTKSSYRFIHHFVDSDGDVGAASTQAATTGVGVLNGGRGGTTIPDADRRAVYNHLAKHLRDGDQEPPELKSRADSEPADYATHDDTDPSDDGDRAEPAAPTRNAPSIADLNRAAALRYGLPRQGEQS